MHYLSNTIMSATPLLHLQRLFGMESPYTSILIYPSISLSKIAMPGKPAGGNVVVVLLRHVSGQKSDCGDEYFSSNVVDFTLWSPSTDLLSQTYAHLDTHRNYITDHLASFTLEWSIDFYFPDSMEITNQWKSRILGSSHYFTHLYTPVPMWMITERGRYLMIQSLSLQQRWREWSVIKWSCIGFKMYLMIFTSWGIRQDDTKKQRMRQLLQIDV